jgi:hypothetical protein
VRTTPTRSAALSPNIRECQDHLLARFDASGDEGELGVGLTAGPLYYVNEIEEVLQRARLSWVQSVRATGKRKAPRWIMKERGLQDYVDALGGLGGFDLEEYDSDEDAAGNLRQYTDKRYRLGADASPLLHVNLHIVFDPTLHRPAHVPVC